MEPLLIQGPPNNFFFNLSGKCFKKKNYWIFSQISFFLLDFGPQFYERRIITVSWWHGSEVSNEYSKRWVLNRIILIWLYWILIFHTFLLILISLYHAHTGSAKYFFFVEYALKKLLNIFSNFFLYLKVQSFRLLMENNFIQMAASAGHTVAYTIGPIFKLLINCVQLYFTNGFTNIML